MSKKNWSAKDIPALTGKVAIVTGANAGIGFETALQLAAHGAHVTLACRNAGKAAEAADRIRATVKGALVDVSDLDLSSRASIDSFIARTSAENDRIDILVNNAGVMMCPEGKTEDGFETQFGTNHLGHFVLTAGLYPLLKKSKAGRIVALSSIAHKTGVMDFNNLNGEKGYKPIAAYGQSKLANLLFAKELARRVSKAEDTVLVVAAHPGWTSTELQRHTPLMRFLNLFFGQKPAQGALPSLYGATAPDATHGGYYGPSGFQELNGAPAPASVDKKAESTEDATKLWAVSEKLTNTKFLS